VAQQRGTGVLGDVLGGSVGEFLKFMPGITADYDNIDIAGISVRGIGGGMTAITSDGAPSNSTILTMGMRVLLAMESAHCSR